MTDLNALMKMIKTLSLEDQRKLNSLLVANIRAGSKLNSIEKSASFAIGDVIKFNGGAQRGTTFVRIEEFTRDHSKVKGPQLNEGRTLRAVKGVRWTVNIGNATIATEAERKMLGL